jgi:hypothetical protein
VGTPHADRVPLSTNPEVSGREMRPVAAILTIVFLLPIFLIALRLYGAEDAFYDQTWKPDDVVKVKRADRVSKNGRCVASV